MLGLILIIAFWGILVVVLTSPSKRIESAEKAFAQGDMNKAEEYLRKVWTKRDDIPAHLAGMYFKLIKKDKTFFLKKNKNKNCSSTKNRRNKRLCCSCL